MDCPRRADQDTAERYVAGTLPELDQSAFEEHFFSCEACLADVQALQAARTALAGQQARASTFAARPQAFKWSGSWSVWAGLAAAAVILVAVATWMRQPAAPASETAQSTAGREGDRAPAVAEKDPADRSAPAPEAPAPGDRGSRPPATPPSRQLLLAQLAVVVPPRFVPLAARGEGSEPTERFNTAMQHYSAARYDDAADALRALAAERPLAHVWFFLGVSELARGRTGAAREALEQAAGSDVQPYADESHFYLAKAALKDGDVERARRELTAAVEREAGPEGEARRILAQLAKLPRE